MWTKTARIALTLGLLAAWGCESNDDSGATTSTTSTDGSDSSASADGRNDATDGTTDSTDGTTDSTDGTTDSTDAGSDAADSSDTTDGASDSTDAETDTSDGNTDLTDGGSDDTDGSTDTTDGTDGMDGTDGANATDGLDSTDGTDDVDGTGSSYWGETCPAQFFMDLSNAEGPGAEYPAPYVNASCDVDTLIVESNGLPHYTFVPLTPNALVAIEATYEFPLNPQVADEPTDIPLLGYAGITIGGTHWYGPNEGAFPDPYGDPVFNGIMDGCGGHTAGAYHHHNLEQKCFMDSGLVAEPWLNGEVDGATPSPILGFAADGFPIYGPHGCVDAECTEVMEFKSGWEVVPGGDPTTYAWDPSDNEGAAQTYNNDGAYHYVPKEGAQWLDKCNGRFGPDGRYRYHATKDFPYILGCYTGTPGEVGGGGGGGNGGPGGGPGGPGGGAGGPPG